MKDRVDILEVGEDKYVISYNENTIPGKKDAMVADYSQREFLDNERENTNLGEVYVMAKEMAENSDAAMEYLERQLEGQEEEENPFESELDSLSI